MKRVRRTDRDRRNARGFLQLGCLDLVSASDLTRRKAAANLNTKKYNIKNVQNVAILVFTLGKMRHVVRYNGPLASLQVSINIILVNAAMCAFFHYLFNDPFDDDGQGFPSSSIFASPGDPQLSSLRVP